MPAGADVIELEHQISRSQLRVARKQIALWAFVPAFLLIHGVVATCLPHWLDPLSTIFIILAELAAIAACLRAARESLAAKGFWLLLIAAMVFHSAAMSVDAFSEITKLPVLDHAPALSILLSMLDGLPLLLAVSFQSDPRVRRSARIIHTSLSIAIGVLIYVQIFGFLPLYGRTNSSDELVITRLFDGMDTFLAVAATIRWLGSTKSQERRFFGVLTTFLWINTLCCAIHNRALMRHDDWIWLDLLVAAPYALLVPLALIPRHPSARAQSNTFVRAVRIGSPMLLAAILVVLGIIEARSQLYFGIAAALFAIIGYGILNILVQSRGLATEESLIASNQALERLVDQDALTGIANRRAFDETLQREFTGTIRNRQPLSLLMIDVDLFKDLNDARGHIIGDEYLIHVATLLRLALPRATDFIARYGGEEFSAILPATDKNGALIAAEKVRNSISAFRLPHPTSPFGVLTVSVGVSTFDGSISLTPATLIGSADRALYKAKRSGRNCCLFQAIERPGWRSDVSVAGEILR